MDERTPLMQFPGSYTGLSTTVHLGDEHHQFCQLVGVKPHTLPPGQSHTPHPESLYMRATRHRRSQAFTYAFTATMTNGMLLSQVVLGAALTALGASDSSRVLITLFGAMNTVIAGLIAFLKARGQPVRARMFRDDLDRVVDEIENSATMWLGISRNAHGYDAIDTDDAVTVRSEVARLTRLYDRAVKTNTMNDPDMYAAGQPGDPHAAALRKGPVAPVPVAAAPGAMTPVPSVPLAGPTAPIAVDPDDSPATKAPSPPPPPPPPAAVAKPVEDPKPAEPTPAPALPAENPAPPAETPAAPSQPAASTSSDPTPAPAPEQAPSHPITPAPSQPPAPASEPSQSAPAPPAQPVDEDPDASPASAAHLNRHNSQIDRKPASVSGSSEGEGVKRRGSE